ncbi:hypothetical protein [Nocardia miyunensis]|uniref:hypothetical protein n=1 Tax=Nocardia miyunensis TaxID=282684 RepID=UPI000ACEDD9C|nr:hypothetical protein [Nocardia miyunensis]
MNSSLNLRRIRRVAAGISVAAALAIAGLTVETAREEGAFDPASNEATGTGWGVPVAATPVRLVNSVAPQRVSQVSESGDRTPQPSWTPTPQVHTTNKPPHANTAGS